MLIEVWKEAEDLSGEYLVSNKGRVQRKARTVIGRWGKPYTIPGQLSAVLQRKGYQTIHASIRKKPFKVFVHQLVAKAFIPNPENKPSVNHIDNNPANNHIINLEWCTPKENSEHMVRCNRSAIRRGENSNNYKLSDLQVSDIRKRYIKRSKGEKGNRVALALEFGINCSYLNELCRKDGKKRT